jgi:N6-L-threonylcarbamoyladenine synthase
MAFSIFREAYLDVAEPALIVAGGVAANATLKNVLTASAITSGFKLIVPPASLCTDNAAMIAWAGAERLVLGLVDGLDVAARARWPLDEASAPVYGSGKLGAKV